MLVVQKYGGTSLENRERIMAAAHRAADLAQQGAKVVVVVSAQGQTTDEMIQKAVQINPRGAAREMDAFLSAGEQMSAALMAMTLGALGYPAVSLTGWQAGIHTDENHSDAHIIRLDCSRIEKELESGRIAVVAGFQGIGPDGDITTLGRGGSDTTAVALAAALKADRCQIFTDVDGVYNRDPRVYPDATRFGKIGYDRMLSLIRAGAQVLHERSVEIAKERGLRLEVLSSFTGAPGTIVGDGK